MKKAVFVDRDGTLNELVYDETHGRLDSPRKPEQVTMIPGAGRFLRALKAVGYRVIVITNQPGIAKGTLKQSDLAQVNKKLEKLLLVEGSAWDDLVFCPHHPTGGAQAKQEYVVNCDCRKPFPGLILNVAETEGIDLAQSWVVGDGLNDIQAGHAAGCRTILVAQLKIEHIKRFFNFSDSEPDVIAETLDEALQIILRKDGSRVE